MSRADSFDQQLSAHLSEVRDTSNRSQVADARPAPARHQTHEAPPQAAAGPRPKPPAHKPTDTAQPKDRADTPPRHEKVAEKVAGKADKKAAPQKAQAKHSQKSNDPKAVKASATAQNTDSTKTDKGPAPEDGNLVGTAELKSPFAQSSAVLTEVVAKQKATKVDGDHKADDKKKADDNSVDGLPLGALAVGLPAAVQTPEQSAPSKQDDAATKTKTPTDLLPATAGELMAEAVKLTKGAEAAKATDADPAAPAKEGKADAAPTAPLPAPFSALLAAAKSGTLKLQTATSKDGAPLLKATAATTATAGKAKGDSGVLKAQAGVKGDSGTSLSSVVASGKPDITAVNGQPASATATPPTPLAAAIAAKDAPPPPATAPQAGKADASLNPLPFATLSTLGQGPLQINQSPVMGTGPGNIALAAGPAYVAAHVAVQITKTVSDGGNQFSIRLDPAELGRVDVKLHFGHDGSVTAAVSADHQHTLDLLRRDASMLNQAFQDSGLKTDQGSLSFSLRQQWQQQQQGQQAFVPNNQSGRQSVAPESLSDMTIAATSNARHYISNRALDISV